MIMWSYKQQESSHASNLLSEKKQEESVLQMRNYPGKQVGFLGVLHLLCWVCLVLTTWDCAVFPLTNITFAFTLMTSFIVTGLISIASAHLNIFRLARAALVSSGISTIFASLQVTAVLFAPVNCSQWLECGLAQTFVGLVMLATSTVQLVFLTYFCHQETSRLNAVILFPTSKLEAPPAYHEVVGRQVYWIELFQKVPPSINYLC